MMKDKFVKSPLNYTGGKYKLLPQLMPLIQIEDKGRINTFIDLFTGGGNVVANIMAHRKIANDIDNNVISIYKEFQSHDIDNIISYIKNVIAKYSLTMTNQEGFNNFRNDYNSSDCKNPLDLFILICFSFNHQIRFNSKGQYNMPFGKNRSAYNKSIETNLISFKEAIQDVIFTNKSFDELNINKLSTDDYVYCVPPYLITCASYNEQDGWNEDKEKKLLDLLDSLNNKGVRFGLSNVFENKGVKNEILVNWCNERSYNVHHLNNSYSNCSYHGKNKDKATDEVFITNY